MFLSFISYLQGYAKCDHCSGYVLGGDKRSDRLAGLFWAPDHDGRMWIAPDLDLAREIAVWARKNEKFNWTKIYSVYGKGMRVKQHEKSGLLITVDPQLLRVSRLEGRVEDFAGRDAGDSRDMEYLGKFITKYRGR
jgi:hypothetical protein